MGFAENLRAIRKERGISQEKLAELLNVSRQAVSKWEQGTGYPEMEKMITLSEALNVSLDYLVSRSDDQKQAQEKAVTAAGGILIKSYDAKKVINCYKVVSSKIWKNKPDEPQYALFGIDNASFFGENKELLGWYADEDSIQKEIESIYSTMRAGESSYGLKYAAKVKEGFLSIKLVKEAR